MLKEKSKGSSSCGKILTSSIAYGFIYSANLGSLVLKLSKRGGRLVDITFFFSSVSSLLYTAASRSGIH